jgi:uncharacterized membrane protein
LIALLAESRGLYAQGHWGTWEAQNMDFKELISVAGYGIESIGVLIIVAGCAVSSVRFLLHFRKEVEGFAYRVYRRQLGRSIILGLEFLIAGDIIRTVVVADTLANVTILGLIILIRTFLSFTLHLEVEGRWPWQQSKDDVAG